eukprot:1782874-Lingulodinium_polyedra.AAC.1
MCIRDSGCDGCRQARGETATQRDAGGAERVPEGRVGARYHFQHPGPVAPGGGRRRCVFAGPDG